MKIEDAINEWDFPGSLTPKNSRIWSFGNAAEGKLRFYFLATAPFNNTLLE